MQAGDDALTAAELLAGGVGGRRRWSQGACGRRLRRHQRPRLPDRRCSRAAAAGVPFVPAQLPARPTTSSTTCWRRWATSLVVAEGDGGRRRWRRGATGCSTPPTFVATARGRRPTVGEVPADGEGPAVLLYTSGTTVGAEGRRAAPPPPDVLRDRHGRVRRRRARRGRAGERAAVPRRRAGQPAQQPLPRPAHRLPRASSTPTTWVAAVRARGHHQRHGRAHDAGPHRATCSSADGAGLPTPAGAVLRRRPHAGHRCSQRVDGAAPRRRPHQRLRAHRDQLDDRRARARRPPRRPRRRPGRHRPPGVGRPGAAHRRGRGPRRRRRAAAAGRARRDLGAGRAGVGRVRRPRRRRSTPTAGSRPATAAGSTPTATCSSRAAATTRSSGAARTSRRPRSRRCCCAHPDIAQCAVVGVPDDEWGQRIAAVVVLAARRGRSTPTTCRPSPARSLRGSKTPDVVDLRRRAALHRDRQAAAPGRPGRSAADRLTDADSGSPLALC